MCVAELRKAPIAQGYSVLGADELNFHSGPEARGWLDIGDLDHRGHQLQNDLPRVIQDEIERPPWLEAAKLVTNKGSGVSEVVASQVSVRDLKTHLSEWLGRVQAGEVVEVTSHRKPIARITAVKPVASVSTDPLQQAIAAGVISWNGQNPVIPPPVKLNDGGPLMSDIVIEDRG